MKMRRAEKRQYVVVVDEDDAARAGRGGGRGTDQVAGRRLQRVPVREAGAERRRLRRHPVEQRLAERRRLLRHRFQVQVQNLDRTHMTRSIHRKERKPIAEKRNRITKMCVNIKLNRKVRHQQKVRQFKLKRKCVNLNSTEKCVNFKLKRKVRQF
jgi:hypothetical protein